MSLRSLMNAKTVEYCMKHSVGLTFAFFNDTLWIRYSANIYNSKNDYLIARNSILKELKEMKSKSKVFVLENSSLMSTNCTD